jgi:hypothetical protein
VPDLLARQSLSHQLVVFTIAGALDPELEKTVAELYTIELLHKRFCRKLSGAGMLRYTFGLNISTIG